MNKLQSHAVEPEFTGSADFFDGKTARVRRVDFVLKPAAAGGDLRILPPDGGEMVWRARSLRRMRDQADGSGVVMTSTDDIMARLHIDDWKAAAILKARCPRLKSAAPIPNRMLLWGWAAAAIGSLYLIMAHLVPFTADNLAPLLPPSAEKALGTATLEQVGNALGAEFCDNDPGHQALNEMLARLSPELDSSQELTIHVLDSDLFNAFALPGGHIGLFKGLIQAAETPEEVAAVLAHEIAHVVNRDPTRIALRTAGGIGLLGLIFGDFAGGTAMLFLANRLIEADYTREAEARADEFAFDLMARADLPPSALGGLFERARAWHGDFGGFVAYLSSHPRFAERIESANAAEERYGGTPRPVLNETDWLELRRICG